MMKKRRWIKETEEVKRERKMIRIKNCRVAAFGLSISHSKECKRKIEKKIGKNSFFDTLG